jgi:hypothetical protein
MSAPANWLKSLIDLGTHFGTKASPAELPEPSLEEKIGIAAAVLRVRDTNGQPSHKDKTALLMALKKPHVTAVQINEAVRKLDMGSTHRVGRRLDPVKLEIARLANRQGLNRMWQIKLMTDARSKAATFLDPQMQDHLLRVAEIIGAHGEKGHDLIPLKYDRSLALLLKKDDVTESRMAAAYDAAAPKCGVNAVKPLIDPHKQTFLATSIGLVFARKGLLDALDARKKAPQPSPHIQKTVTLSSVPPPTPASARGPG